MCLPWFTSRSFFFLFLVSANTPRFCHNFIRGSSLLVMGSMKNSSVIIIPGWQDGWARFRNWISSDTAAVQGVRAFSVSVSKNQQWADKLRGHDAPLWWARLKFKIASSLLILLSGLITSETCRCFGVYQVRRGEPSCSYVGNTWTGDTLC